MRSLQSITTKKSADVMSMPLMDKPVSEYFNEFVFGPEAKKKHLPIETLEKMNHCIENYIPIDKETADIIAVGLKNWAIDHQVTHYTHWFQPLTGKTSEKHDTFFQFDKNWRAIEKISGRELVVQEPDGSSFPTGGLRSTHEARSYTVWDPTSPIFIRRTRYGRTLCVPAILISYTGESLDLKAPLLKSMKLINDISTKVCKLFDGSVNRVNPTLGWEQEYFVVDEALFNARPDLVLCGRTLFGNGSARGQQLADHYFGAIPERVYNFIIEFEQEALRLGIPIKTRHNEVAPNQFECAPHFEFANIAADHNLLLMDKIDKVAIRHGLRVLIHEKPFQGINGSGKHNNWSLATDSGINLLEPGDNPHKNLMFLTFFINTLAAVYKHSDLLRASIASAGNDHRLGANEAPPAIISAFIGDNMERSLEAFMNDTEPEMPVGLHEANLDYLLVPFKKQHTTDRNRTSPFPFTGNKFEFRAPGSSVNVSLPMTVLNIIVADQLADFYAKIEAEMEIVTSKQTPADQLPQELDNVIRKILKETYSACTPILFNGDNYEKEWVEEAERRGLPNLKSTPEALTVFLKKENIDIFERNGIYSEREVIARYNVAVEEYVNKLEIESALIDEISQTLIVPAVVNYQNDLIKNVQGLKDLGLLSESEAHKNQLLKISHHLEGMIKNLELLEDCKRELAGISDMQAKAEYLGTKIKPIFDIIRFHADKLEMIVDDKFWQLPKYRELLFIH
jgi:glutamine synthetase